MHDAIKSALQKHFKGKNAEERLEAATRDVVTTVKLIQSENNKPAKKLGVTIMTEKASSQTLSGDYTSPPTQI